MTDDMDEYRCACATKKTNVFSFCFMFNDNAYLVGVVKSVVHETGDQGCLADYFSLRYGEKSTLRQ